MILVNGAHPFRSTLSPHFLTTVGGDSSVLMERRAAALLSMMCIRDRVYTLLNVDRGVPEVFGSCYDVRVLLDSTSKMMDGKKLTDLKLPLSLIHI